MTFKYVRLLIISFPTLKCVSTLTELHIKFHLPLTVYHILKEFKWLPAL